MVAESLPQNHVIGKLRRPEGREGHGVSRRMDSGRTQSLASLFLIHPMVRQRAGSGNPIRRIAVTSQRCEALPGARGTWVAR